MHKQRILEHFATTGMHKGAGTFADALGDIAWSNIPLIGPAATAAGAMHGMVSAEDTTSHDEDKMDRSPGASLLLPGVGTSRLIRRAGNQTRKSTGSHNQGKLWSQLGGQALTRLVPAVAGYYLAKGFEQDEKQKDKAGLGGAMAGYALGGGVNLLAGLLAAMTKTRTKEEQQEYANNGSALADILIPGRGAYNFWKSIGRAHADSGQRAYERSQRPVIREDMGSVVYAAPINAGPGGLQQADIITALLSNPDVLAAIKKQKAKTA